MKLGEILKNIENKTNLNLDMQVDGITANSKNVEKNFVFVCLCGTNSNGHDFAKEAIQNGAVAIVCETPLEQGIAQILVKSTRAALSILCSNFYGNPQNNFKTIGITGTNGKTTTSFLIKSILEQSGKKVGLIGTQGAFFGKQFVSTNFTTPDPEILFKVLKDMANFGVEYVVMEVSAHALFLEKVCAIKFDVAVFTNLTQDHLDFFGTMQNYKNAKFKLFENAKAAILNFDDDVGLEISKTLQIPYVSYATGAPSDVFALNITLEFGKTNYVVNLLDNVFNVKSNLIGSFNVSNSLAAAATCAILGFNQNEIKNGLEALECVPGRVNSILLANGAVAVVDFAHTPDGIEKVLLALKQLKFKRIITVFGCSGNKDKSKRSIMGQIAEKLSDFVVLTSDNPCYENPQLIIEDIEHGMKKTAHTRFIERKDAISFAIKLSRKGDVVAILGKGGEDFQDVNGVKIPYSDFEVVALENETMQINNISKGGVV